MRGIRHWRGNARRSQLIITGQSLGVAVKYVTEALQFYKKGWGVFNTSVGATAYSGLKRGTYPFTRSVVAGGGAVVCIHGETDAWIYPLGTEYAGFIAEWASDYQNALGGSVPFLLTQCSSRGYDYGDGFGNVINRVALAQYTASTATDNIYCVGPMYQYAYSSDQIHLTEAGYQHLGQKCAQVAGRIIAGTAWKPLSPTTATRSGSVITVNFNIPVGPLVVDTTTVSARANHGFVFYEPTFTNTISSVSVGTAAITINLNGTPAAPGTLYYAYYVSAGTAIPDWDAAPSYAVGGLMAGNIRDSDTAAEYVGGSVQMGNWLTHFSAVVT